MFRTKDDDVVVVAHDSTLNGACITDSSLTVDSSIAPFPDPARSPLTGGRDREMGGVQ